ncbi:MAG TPA: DUF4251 domain-containing protein [Ohtaekwangia sp.]
MKLLNLTLLFWALIISVSGFAQEPKSETDGTSGIKALIDSKHFVFMAESATPMRGGFRTLSPGYTLQVSGDTLTCDLPYYGRAYTAPINPAEAGMKFTSLKFDYTVKDKKKKGWTISIKTKDQVSTVQINISAFSNGSASVYINSTDRQSISYSGRIESKK